MPTEVIPKATTMLAPQRAQKYQKTSKHIYPHPSAATATYSHLQRQHGIDVNKIEWI